MNKKQNDKNINFGLSEEGLIIVSVTCYSQTTKELTENFFMVLDTGCTHTVLHTKKAEKLGFKKSRRNKSTGMSTAAGVIISHSFSPLFFEALGMNIEDMPLEIADVDITNEYAGYLGLDFLVLLNFIRKFIAGGTRITRILRI